MRIDFQLVCGLVVASVWADSSVGQSAALTRQRSQVRPLFRLPRFATTLFSGAVVQPGLGRQIVNLEVAGSNPVGPAIFCGSPLDGVEGRHIREGKGVRA